MKDELVSFETARLSKEKGFDFASPPTQSLLQRWLREKHNYNIEITQENGYWCYIIKTLPSDEDRLFATSGLCQDGDLWLRSEIINPSWYTQEFESYEKALEEGLKNTLEIIE